MAEVLFRAKLVREDSSIPWGFRLQGGADYDKPLTLLKVTPESIAAKGGLHPSDIVVKLAGKSSDGMTHKKAQEVIISAGNQLEIIVERAEEEVASASTSGSSNESLESGSQSSEAKQAADSQKEKENKTSSKSVKVNNLAPSAPVPPKSATKSAATPTVIDSSKATVQTSSKQDTSLVPSTRTSKETVTTSVVNAPTSSTTTVSAAMAVPVATTVSATPEKSSIPDDVKEPNKDTTAEKSNANIPVKPVSDSTKSVVLPSPASSAPDLMVSQSDSIPQVQVTVSSTTPAEVKQTSVSKSTVVTPTVAVTTTHPAVKEEKLLATADETRTSRNVTRFQGSPGAVGSPTAPWRKPRDATPSSSSSDSDIDAKSRDNKVQRDSLKQDNNIKKPLENQNISEPKKVIKIPVVHTTTKSDDSSEPKDFSKVAPWRTGHSSTSTPVQSKPMASTELQTSIAQPVVTQSVTETKKVVQVSVPVASDTKQSVPSSSSSSAPLHPWRKPHHKEETSSTSSHSPDSIHARAQSAPVTSLRKDTSLVKEEASSQQGGSQTPISQVSEPVVQTVEEPHVKVPLNDTPVVQDSSVQPSLTFIGRRIESPTMADSPVGKNPFSHIIHETQGSTTGRGSPLAKSLLGHRDSPTGRGSPLTIQTPSNNIGRVTAQPIPQQVTVAEPSSAPRSHPIPVIHTSQTAEAVPIFSLTVPEQQETSHSPIEEGYHSPRPDDIYFSAASPDLVDIPMPAVKEMVADLNRRLEAIAAQQPKIAQPPTAQELGLSFLKKDQLKALQKSLAEAEERGEIFVGADPTALANLKQKLFGPDPEVSGAFHKIYDISSPLSSPTIERKYTVDFNRIPSPRSGRRVHFADPPEQSVIEIEPSVASRRRVKREEEPPTEYPSPYELAETLERESQNLSKPLPARPVPITSNPNFLTPTYSIARQEPQHFSTQVKQETSYLTNPSSVSSRPIETHHFLHPTLSISTRTESVVPGQNLPNRGDSSPIHQYLTTIPTERIPSPSLAQMYSSYLEREQRRASPLSHLERLSPRGAGDVRFVGQPNIPGATGPRQINVSITHKRPDQGQPTRFNFTIPPGQPGQPSYFRYTLSPRKSSEPAGITYSFPPSYEESMRSRQQRSYDDSRLHQMYAPRPLDPALYLRTSAGPLSPPIRRGPPSPIYVNTAGGPLSSPSASPVYANPTMRLLSPPQSIPARGPPSPVLDTTQGKSFRVLEANMGPGVAQPAAIGRSYTPSLDQPGPIAQGMPPGLFALFDKSFTEKFMQWQSQRSGNLYESETCRLVREMDDETRYPP